MFLRHFHATVLVLVGIFVFYFLSLAIGKKPFVLPKPSLAPKVSITPSALEQTRFLFDDSTGSYESLSIFTVETAAKQGIYGAPKSLSDTYTKFFLYSNQVYMQGLKTSGVVNLTSHFFNTTGSLPLTVSPTRTKALYASTTTDPKSKSKLTLFRLQTTDSTTSAKLSFPKELGSTAQPVCWSQDENIVVFSTPLKKIVLYNLKDQSGKEFPLAQEVKEYTKVYCNPQSNTLYFVTAKAVYKQQLDKSSASHLLVDPAMFSSPPVFQSEGKQDTIMVGNGNSLVQVDLGSGAKESIYTATDSATLTPYLWKDDTIVYTQRTIKPDHGSHYLAGKVLDRDTQVVNVFARHQSAKPTSLGSITPIEWIDQPVGK